MIRVFKSSRLLCVLLMLSCAALAQTKRPLTFDGLMAVKRLADAQIAPDGSKVAYVISDVDKNANRSKRSIWVIPTHRTVGSVNALAVPLITSDKNDFSPRWSADGKWLAFLSTRDGAPQI